MGKRKLHDSSFYQCDWTGFTMQSSNCYMPTWASSLPNEKVSKRGSYCNWESVVAHANYRFIIEKKIDQDDLDRVHLHVASVVGVGPKCAPHYTELEHIKDSRGFSAEKFSMLKFHDECCYETGELETVKIKTDGSIEAHSVDSTNGKFEIRGQKMFPVRKSKQAKMCVFHSDGSSEDAKPPAINKLATSLFKMQMYGDVIVTCISGEESFMPRVRFVDYNRDTFMAEFIKKKRGSAPDMTTEEYGKVKGDMAAAAASFEAGLSATALPPALLAKVKKLKPVSGSAIAKKAIADKLPGWEKSRIAQESAALFVNTVLADERA